MRKRLALLLLMKLSGLLLHRADAQSRLSLEHYYTMGTGSPVTMMPVASFQTSNNFYAEGRYNYEAPNSFSFYMGRTFSKEATFSYSISPIAGAVMGEYSGGSFGANMSLGYKNFFLYIQPQYTFSLAGSVNNFAYSWSDLTYSPLNWLSVGVSVQHTKPQRSPGFLEGGLVVEAAYKKITFPMYLFSPHTSERMLVFGANFEVNFKKSKGKQRRESDSFKDVYPVNIIANTPQSEPSVPEEKVKTAEPIVNVRRVNVVVRTKSEQTIIKKNSQESDKLALDKVVKMDQQIPETSNTAASRKPSQTSSKLSGAAAIKSKTAVLGPDLKEAPKNVAYTAPLTPIMQFALVLGPFKNESDALAIKSRLSSLFDREILIYADEKGFKLRVPGFEDEKAAEVYSQNASNEGCKVAVAIVQYRIKSIDAIPLKNNPKPFEATKL